MVPFIAQLLLLSFSHFIKGHIFDENQVESHPIDNIYLKK